VGVWQPKGGLWQPQTVGIWQPNGGRLATQFDLPRNRFQCGTLADQFTEGSGPRNFLAKMFIFQLEPFTQRVDLGKRAASYNRRRSVVGDHAKPAHTLISNCLACKHGQYPKHLPSMDDWLASEAANPLGSNPVGMSNPIGKRFRQFRLFERLASEGNASNFSRSKRESSEGSFSVRPFDARRYDGPTRTGY
jgi:hypothetical protein